MAPGTQAAVNQHVLSWVNPTSGTDENGNVLPLALSDIVAIEIQFDGGNAIEIPYPAAPPQAQGTFDLLSLDQYKALAAGSHTVDLAVKTAEGVIGGYSATASFQIAPATFTPAAPTNVQIA